MHARVLHKRLGDEQDDYRRQQNPKHGKQVRCERRPGYGDASKSGSNQVYPQALVQDPDARKLLLSFAQAANIFTFWGFVRCVRRSFASREFSSGHGRTVSFQTE
jgi:hypothetical protein